MGGLLFVDSTLACCQPNVVINRCPLPCPWTPPPPSYLNPKFIKRIDDQTSIAMSTTETATTESLTAPASLSWLLVVESLLLVVVVISFLLQLKINTILNVFPSA